MPGGSLRCTILAMTSRAKALRMAVEAFTRDRRTEEHRASRATSASLSRETTRPNASVIVLSNGESEKDGALIRASWSRGLPARFIRKMRGRRSQARDVQNQRRAEQDADQQYQQPLRPRSHRGLHRSDAVLQRFQGQPHASHFRVHLVELLAVRGGQLADVARELPDLEEDLV